MNVMTKVQTHLAGRGIRTTGGINDIRAGLQTHIESLQKQKPCCLKCHGTVKRHDADNEIAIDRELLEELDAYEFDAMARKAAVNAQVETHIELTKMLEEARHRELMEWLDDEPLELCRTPMDELAEQRRRFSD